jgi:hypothetical protein
VAFEPKLIKLSIIEGTEFGRRTAQCLDKPELRADGVDDHAEPSPLDKLETIFGFSLCLDERLSRREEDRIQGVSASGRLLHRRAENPAQDGHGLNVAVVENGVASPSCFDAPP